MTKVERLIRTVQKNAHYHAMAVIIKLFPREDIRIEDGMIRAKNTTIGPEIGAAYQAASKEYMIRSLVKMGK